MEFSHVGISVGDIGRSIAFYRDMFGLEPLMDIMPFGGEQYEAIMDIPGVTGRLCMIGKGSTNLELFEFDQSQPKDPNYPVSDRGISHFGLFVDDIAATCEKLKAAGVRIHSPVITFNRGSMKAAYCRDPDGNVFEILERGKAG
ncbi:MAG: VOC family protein [Novosphingobium sp.]|jgi:catechol 2,3-dioxygenase-like lactoylglutathione lyase family enzyme|nr:VOC family protein [Novosphingobium sp.]